MQGLKRMFYYLAQYLLAILRDDGVESALIKFADDTKVGVDGSTSEDGIRIQNYLDTLEKQSKTIKTECSNNTYKALHEGMKDQMHKYKMRNHRRGARTEKKRMWELQYNSKQISAKQVNLLKGKSRTEMYYYRSVICNRELFSSARSWWRPTWRIGSSSGWLLKRATRI